MFKTRSSSCMIWRVEHEFQVGAQSAENPLGTSVRNRLQSC